MIELDTDVVDENSTPEEVQAFFSEVIGPDQTLILQSDMILGYDVGTVKIHNTHL